MNILLLNTGRAWGGMETHSIMLARSLMKLGHNIILGCKFGRVVHENALKYSIPAVDIRVANAMDIVSFNRIINLCKQEKIDVIITNLGKEYWPATLAAKMAGTKILLVRHQLNPPKKMTAWLIANYVDEIVGVSGAVKKSMISAGIPAERIHVIHPGLEIERFQSIAVHREAVRREFGITEAETVIATAGKLHHGKGIFELLEAFASIAKQHPEVKLMYIGEGMEQAALESRAEEMSIRDRVIFTGFRNDIERFYAAIDIFALPSKFYESFGMVIIEAMAAGKPVVATNTGGIPEIITDGQNGLLVPTADAISLANALARIIENPENTRRFVAEACDIVNENFTVDAIGRKFNAVLKNM